MGQWVMASLTILLAVGTINDVSAAGALVFQGMLECLIRSNRPFLRQLKNGKLF